MNSSYLNVLHDKNFWDFYNAKEKNKPLNKCESLVDFAKNIVNSSIFIF